MDLESYVYFSSNNYKDYEFFSEGPKGHIKKAVRFVKINDEPIIYNLGFGDIDENANVINDNIVSNNEDRDKILATVAYTIVDFTNHYGNHYVFATGSTPARTRLYQISIAGSWEEIKKDFELYGYLDDRWKPFAKNVNYEAFLIKRK